MTRTDSFPFAANVAPAEQVEVIHHAAQIDLVAYTDNWWSKGATVAITLFGGACCFGAVVWLFYWLSETGHSSVYFSVGLVATFFTVGLTAIKYRVQLTQNRLELTLEEDFFTVRHCILIFQERQNYAYENIVAIQKNPALKILTKNTAYTRVWGDFLEEAQVDYLVEALTPIWKVTGKTTGEQEDWSRHLLE
ncbi:MAG: hypothetical protein ACRBFS_25810 [Aureispira sp.]